MTLHLVSIEFTCPVCEQVYRVEFTRSEAQPILMEIEAQNHNFRVCDACAEDTP